MNRRCYIVGACVAIVVGILLFGKSAKVAVDNFRKLDDVYEGLTGGIALQGAANNVAPDTVRFTLRPEEIKKANDLIFVLGQGGGWHGFNVLKIGSDGAAEFTFGGETTGEWKRANFQFSTEEMLDLRNKIIELDLFALERMYSAGANDGTQWFLKIQASGQRKAVWCDNHFPYPMVKLSEFIGKQLVRHKTVTDKAEKIELKREDVESIDWRDKVNEK